MIYDVVTMTERRSYSNENLMEKRTRNLNPDDNWSLDLASDSRDQKRIPPGEIYS